MSSPFPGMNPYLEHHHFWPDFHTSFIPTLREVITEKLPADYVIAVQDNIYIHESDDERTLIGAPDIDVTFTVSSKTPKASGGAAILSAPATVTIPKMRKRKVPFLQVIDGGNQKVVTVIELLSPSNKYAGADRESYLTKRRELFATSVNLVELDFLRGGPRLPLKDLPACSYYAMISRPPARPKADIWPIQLRDPLPSIPIPLREREPEPMVNLQDVLNRVYDRAGYARRIYRDEPEPQLSPADAEWAKEILAAAAKV